MAEETIYGIFQRIAFDVRKIDGVFNITVDTEKRFRVYLKKRLAHLHPQARERVRAFLAEHAPGIDVSFDVIDQEFPSGALAPDEPPPQNW